MLRAKGYSLARHLTKYLFKKNQPPFIPIRNDNCLSNILGIFILIYLSSAHRECQLRYNVYIHSRIYIYKSLIHFIKNYKCIYMVCFDMYIVHYSCIIDRYCNNERYLTTINKLS